ncbi:MAG TPA: PmoA family protein [Ohtaekwangia sp.]|nr:PmoA family protein [Ohtaekwangia sp.]
MKSALLSLLSIFAVASVSAQKPVATLQFENIPDQRHSFPVQFSLSKPVSPDVQLVLVESRGKDKVSIPVQSTQKGSQLNHIAIISPGESTKGKRTFQVVQQPHSKSVANMHADKKDGDLVISSGGKNLLQYRYETMYPPAGVDSVFKRSAFIHPLWSPHGQVLTRIQPPDHYHHYGIWNPWTHILFDGDTVDLWNLNRKHGTVRFAGFKAIEQGPVFSSYSALHEHVVFKKGGEEVIMNEIQTITVYTPEENAYIVDIDIEMRCATNKPVTLLEYRYAGLGWRTTEQWDNQNSTVLTSEGNSRKNADGSRARWCLVQGEVDGVNAGVLMMSSPANYNHPEPLRIWPENQYKRGDMFANFNPTKDRDWVLEPGKPYKLTYRLLVFNGNFDEEMSEAAWNNFAASPALTIK